MKTTITFIGILLFFCSSLFSQRTTGLLLDEEALRAIPVQPDDGDGGKSDEDQLNGVLKVDLRPFCPEVKDQGTVPSCVGWAAGYGAYTIQTAIAKGWKGQTARITENAFSALFIYNQIRERDCNTNSKLSDALVLLAEKGELLYRDFEADQSDCMQMPRDIDLEKAKHYRIKAYSSLFHPEDGERKKILRIKKSLANHQPVIFTMEVRENFLQLKRGDKFWWPDLGNTPSMGHHAMVVVGFNDGDQSFEIMNSWGSLWGEDGFFKIKYADFTRYCQFAFNLTITQEKQENDALSGNFFIRQVSVSNNRILHHPIGLFYNGKAYEFNEPLPIGTNIQLVAQDVTPGTYFYVFSLDPERQVQVHWPRDELFDAQFTGRHESAVILGPDGEVIVPGPINTLLFNKPGPQTLYLLVSRKPLTNLNHYLSEIEASSSSGLHLSSSIFQNHQDPSTKVYYDKNEMIFFTTDKAVGVVPITIHLSVN